MRVFLTGATGFVGQALSQALIARGDVVVAWTRDSKRARTILGELAVVEQISESEDQLRRALQSCDAVVNLAGEGLFRRRWSPDFKRELRRSRVDLSLRLSRAIQSLEVETRPRALVAASAVGYYGSSGEDPAEESTSPGSDFLAQLCVDWEQASLQANQAQVRTVILRLGVVLGKQGGALSRLLTPFKLGLGGKLGSGEQPLPWIHLDDLIAIILGSLDEERWSGPFNAVAPEQVSNQELTRVLSKCLHRPALFKAPSFALKITLGESAESLLLGRAVRSTRLSAAGFTFRFPELEAALRDCLAR